VCGCACACKRVSLGTSRRWRDGVALYHSSNRHRHALNTIYAGDAELCLSGYKTRAARVIATDNAVLFRNNVARSDDIASTQCLAVSWCWHPGFATTLQRTRIHNDAQRGTGHRILIALLTMSKPHAMACHVNTNFQRLARQRGRGHPRSMQRVAQRNRRHAVNGVSDVERRRNDAGTGWTALAPTAANRTIGGI
jgi:hypothetical protein